MRWSRDSNELLSSDIRNSIHLNNRITSVFQLIPQFATQLRLRAGTNAIVAGKVQPHTGENWSADGNLGRVNVQTTCGRVIGMIQSIGIFSPVSLNCFL